MSEKLKTCRACMQNKTRTASLFDVVKSKSTTLADMFNVCTAIQIIKDDGLPQRICNLCTESLTIAYDFRIQCEITNTALQQLCPESKNRSNLQTSKDLSCHNIIQPKNEVTTEIKSEVELDYTINSDQRSQSMNKYKAIFTCKFCDEIFAMRIDLVRHQTVHSEDERPKVDESRPHICDICGQSFKKRGILRGHKQIHSIDNPYLCNLCGKGFKTRVNLRQHASVHAVLKTFGCHLCPIKFKSKALLSKHIKTHSDTKDHICDICGRSFNKYHALKIHKDIHTGLKPWKCDSCPKTFSHSDRLKRHQIIHTGAKPFECPFCDKAYNQKNNLTIHLRSHVGENQYECTVCNEKFRLQSDLKKHYPTHYTKILNQL